MGERLSIALVSREYPPFFGGGIGTYARWIAPALASAGVSVHVVTEAHDGEAGREERDGLVTVHRVAGAIGPHGWTPAALRFAASAGRRVATLARRGLVDVVEFAECEAAGVPAAALRAGGVGLPPMVVHLHTPSEVLFALRSLSSPEIDVSLGCYFAAERAAIRLADAVCAPSRFIASFAAEHYGLDREPVVIPYAIGPLPRVREMGPGRTVLYAGRIEPRKGVEVLARAWGEVVARHPGAELRLAGADTGGAPGGGSMRAYLGQVLGAVAGEAGRRSVVFLGKLTPEELAAEYGRASLCVVPSLWENFPNTCIEAMTHARAVVVSDMGGMAEMIGGTEAGVVFPSGDPSACAAAIAGLLAEPRDRLVARGMAGRRRIASMCDAAAVASRRIELYRQVIRGEHSASASVRSRGMLELWRGLEGLSRRGGDPGGMPVLPEAIARWVDGTRDAAVEPMGVA